MLKVQGHRVLIKALDVAEVDKVLGAAKRAGIVLPSEDDNAMRRNAVDRGFVVGIGSTAFKDFGGEPWCQVGDQVYFSKYAGKVLKDPGTAEEFVLINDEDILTVIVEE